LIIYKYGAGRLYYRLGLKYAPQSFKLPEKFFGFKVFRTYAETKDNEAKNDPVILKDSIWKVKKGKRVKITIEMEVEHKRFNVALVDKLVRI
jgi:hypothetical protein